MITPNLWAPNQWLFLIACRLLGKKVYTWEHGIKTKKIRTIWVYHQKVYRLFLTGSFLYGEKARQTMIELGFNAENLHVVYNSLNYEKSRELRNKLFPEPLFTNHFRNTDPVLLFIGRITKEKKLDLLLAAQKVLADKGVKTNIVFIGGGDIIDTLKAKLQENDLANRVWFCGEVYEEEVISKLLYNATICISPGNIGLTAIHAFSYGLPVITNSSFETQGPEHEIIEESKTGMFFMEGNAESLAEKIQWWLLNKTDREQIRNDCYQQIDTKYNIYTQIEIFSKVFYQVPNQSR